MFKEYKLQSKDKIKNKSVILKFTIYCAIMIVINFIMYSFEIVLINYVQFESIAMLLLKYILAPTINNIALFIIIYIILYCKEKLKLYQLKISILRFLLSTLFFVIGQSIIAGVTNYIVIEYYSLKNIITLLASIIMLLLMFFNILNICTCCWEIKFQNKQKLLKQVITKLQSLIFFNITFVGWFIVCGVISTVFILIFNTMDDFILHLLSRVYYIVGLYIVSYYILSLNEFLKEKEYLQ